MEVLLELDRDLFLLMNGWHGTLGDAVFTLLSGRLPWIPVGIVLALVLIRRLGWREALLVVLGAGLVILLADQLSASLLKPWTMRLRPCHSPDLEGLVHLPTGKCGGNYGFVSSHAANFFGLAIFLGVVLRRGWVLALLLVIAGLVGYSRIYLGVHYLGDVLGGALLGGGLGGLVAWQYMRRRLRLLEFIHKRA